MHLSYLRLLQFKNYADQRLNPSPGLNCFVGGNGAGKTNLLQAIYYLCVGKDHASAPDQYTIRHGDAGSRLEGTFLLDRPAAGSPTTDEIVVKIQKRKRKVITRNGAAYDRLADHVGRYPVVIVVPDDDKLVREGSEQRRRLLDNSLCQTDPAYLRHLLAYNRLLASRNARLKELEGRPDPAGLLAVYDQQLTAPATYLHAARAAFVEPFTQLLTEAYATISGNRETVGVVYRSQLTDASLADLLAERRDKDRILQRTTSGIHKDDLVFTQDGHPLRRVASQGQLKSFVLSLKLAQYRLLERTTRRPPILLLDDIFDKLDRDRVRALLDLVLTDNYGQVFLTDTDRDRVGGLLRERTGWKRFGVADGVATEEE